MTTASPSGSAKCLRFGHCLTLCTLNMHLLTYLLVLLMGRLIKIKILIIYPLFFVVSRQNGRGVNNWVLYIAMLMLTCCDSDGEICLNVFSCWLEFT